jgi:hypothetical protein
MSTRITAPVFTLAAVILICQTITWRHDLLFGQVKPNAPNQRIRISGRVVDPNGAPIANGGVALYLYGTGQLADAHAPDTDGRFTLTCRPFSKYEFTATFQGLDIVPPKFIEVAGADMDLGDIRLSPTPDSPVRHPYIELKGELRLEQIIVDPQREAHDWRDFKTFEISKERPGASENRSCGSFSHLNPSVSGSCEFRPDTTIEQFVGGKVKQVRVVRFWGMPKTTVANIRDEVRRVWLGPFCCPRTAIMWSEGNMWNVQAIVEFEDGTHRSFLTDGVHVQVEDRNGRFWFIRLRPAVD